MSIKRTLALWTVATSALTPLAVWAQTAPGAAAAPTAAVSEPADLGEVVVTGSTVIRNGYQAPTPVTTLTADQLLDTSPNRLGEALLQLPAFRASPNPRATLQPTLGLGNATLSLRGLGSNRTLVLIDGRRFVPASQRGDYDVELVPSTLLQRVDIVTGGASAQYGSDAVGGVVNLVLNTKYRGLGGQVQGGVSKYNDGGSWRAELAYGGEFLDGRARLIASYAHVFSDEIDDQASRPWGRRSVGIVTIAGATPANQILDNVGQPASFGGAVIAGPLVNGQQGIQFLAGGVVAPYDLGSPRSAAATVNSSGSHIVQGITSGLENDNAFAHVDFDLTPDVRLYADVIGAKQRAFYKIGYPNFQFGSTPFTIFSGNAYLPASLQADLTTRGIASFQLHRNSRDLGGMPYTRITQEVLNLTGGFEAKAGAWTYGAYATWGRNYSDNIALNNINIERLYAATDAVRDASGQIVCRVAVTNPGVYPGCVPVNLFGEGSPSQAAIDYVAQDMPWTTEIIQKSVAAYARAEVFELPAGPVALGFGGEMRRQSLEQEAPALSRYVNLGTGIRGFPTSLINRQGGFGTLNVQSASGDVSVKEGFAEVLVPLAKDVALAKSLSLNAAIRYTDYSTSGGVTTYKIGGTYEPIGDIRVRATYSRDIRAPNLGELYVAGSSLQSQVTDPNLGGRSYLTFARGVPAQNLKPEIGETYSIGVVLAPRFAPRFTASVDYYNISVKGLVSTLTPQQTVDACAQGSTFNCSLISRDAATGQISGVVLPSQNLAVLETEGVDLDASYATDFAGGTLQLRAIVNYTPHYIQTVPGALPIDYAGETGIGANLYRSNPKWTGTYSATYRRGPFEATVLERYIGKGTYDVTKVEGVTINDNSMPAVWYTDLSLRYRLEVASADSELFLSINNLFNKTPPLFPNGSPILPSQYNRLLYDGIGRYYTAGLKFKF